MTYIFKPLTIILIIIIAFQQDLHISLTYKTFIILGLIFSLIGDVFLMLKKSDFFIQGLSAFLIAHIAYLISITGSIGFQLNYITLIPVIFILIGFSRIIIPKTGNKKNYVMVYSSIVFILLWQAVNRFLFLPNDYTLYAAVGIMLFVVSDSLLAYNKFVKSFKYAQIIILVTYYSAQLLIALSI